MISSRFSQKDLGLGVQYFRPPFPIKKYWKEDLRKIKQSGFDTIQLWVVWAWVESSPGKFVFDDYDYLVRLASEEGLSVLLSTIAELQPHWIHREVPGSEMIDHRGLRVISSNREESHFGLTPGGCTQHPEVWNRMAGFLSAVVRRYSNEAHLCGWDAWNELRWHEQSDGLVCFCSHCLASFHQWLERKYGGLDELNTAWLRRYSSWDDVAPGKLPGRPFTEMIEWQRFTTWKANRHSKARYDLIKALDPIHPVTVHAGDPSPLASGWPEIYAVDRGNDWDYADDLDGVGCSSFPLLFGMDQTAFTVRVECARSAAGMKKLWLSEIQGGQGALGFQPTLPVDARSQQQWLWRGLAQGAEKILFWCWRDEVFGRESAGFGIAGNDGQADERLAAMSQTGNLLRKHRALLADYSPQKAVVGVFFSPSSYYLYWALLGEGLLCRQALEGYCRALVSHSIPYMVIEENHLDQLEGLKLLFLPRVCVLSDKQAQAMTFFVQNGGTLVCESESGAYTSTGLYRYPSERFLAELTRGGEAGRRTLPKEGKISLKWPGGQDLSVTARQWLTPWVNFPGEAWSTNPEGVLIGKISVGKGQLIYVGSFLGDGVLGEENSSAFEQFVLKCVEDAGTSAALRIEPAIEGECHIRCGRSGNQSIAFLFIPEGTVSVRLTVDTNFFGSTRLQDLITEKIYICEKKGLCSLTIEPSSWGAVLLASCTD